MWFAFIISIMNADHIMNSSRNSLDEVNDQFNHELSKQIAGTLPKGHIYRLGYPGNILLSTGFPDLPIELSSTRLYEKSKQDNHPYEIIDIRNIVLSLQSPLAIFSYGDKEKSQNVIIELKHKSKYFLVGMFITYYKEIDVISIRGLFPKDTAEWLNWIIQGKSLYLNKQKIQALIDQQRINLADVAYLDLNLVESLLETFVNPLQR